jgi:hypothetical protein
MPSTEVIDRGVNHRNAAAAFMQELPLGGESGERCERASPRREASASKQKTCQGVRQKTLRHRDREPVIDPDMNEAALAH